jgi:MFS family permease
VNNVINDYKLFKYVSFRSLWLGEIISEFGGTLASLSNAIYVYQQNGSSVQIGTLWLIYFIPSLLVQLFIGPVIDRISKKKLMVFSQLGRAIIFCFLLLLLLIGDGPIWAIYIVQFILGCIQPIYAPIGMTILPTIIHPNLLSKANATFDGTLRLMSFLGPTIGGLFLSFVEIKWAYTVVCILFIVSAINLAKMKEVDSNSKPKVKWLSQIIGGYIFFLSNKQIVWLAFFTSIVQFGVGVTLVINLPYILNEMNGTTFMYGLFSATFPLGYVIGSIVVGRMNSMHLRFKMLIGLLIGGLSFVGLSFAENYLIVLICELISGIFLPFFNVNNTTILQRSVPKHVMGSVFSIRLLFIRTMMPFGIFFARQTGDILGERTLYLLIGTLIFGVAICGLILPYLKILENNETLIEKEQVI